MMIVFGSVRIGLIGLIPNITPAIVVGGLMGWMDYPLDMMTATIMPMILGLAVDDTIHFINHGHLEFDRQRNYRSAILRSFRIVGTPLVLTSVIIIVNFSMIPLPRACCSFTWVSCRLRAFFRHSWPIYVSPRCYSTSSGFSEKKQMP